MRDIIIGGVLLFGMGCSFAYGTDPKEVEEVMNPAYQMECFVVNDDPYYRRCENGEVVCYEYGNSMWKKTPEPRCMWKAMGVGY